MNAQDIQPGRSYACKYRDLSGEPALALILTRDTEKQLLRIQDTESGHTMTVSYTSVWDIDTVEWQDG